MIPVPHYEFMLPITSNQLPTGTQPLDCYQLTIQNNRRELVKQTGQIDFDFDTVTKVDRDTFSSENLVDGHPGLVGSTVKLVGKPLHKSLLCAVDPELIVSLVDDGKQVSAWFQEFEYYLGLVVSIGSKKKSEYVPVSLARVP